MEQLRHRIADAISEGTLALGARLPSWSDLASQLGVARGTVRQAYSDLADAQLIVTAGAKGTRVSARPPGRRDNGVVSRREQAGFPYFALEPLPLQIGVPSQAAFPAALWTRLGHRAMRETLNASVGYPDPCGEPGLRREIACHLALARGLACDPAQILITSGYGAGLVLVLRALHLAGEKAWMEEPGYPVAREALRLAGIEPIPIHVDSQGMNVELAIAKTPGARVAIVTPGQQAPLGVALSRSRREALLAWAAEKEAWIIEDDYLAELQITGQAARALAAGDAARRTIYLGTFSKTVSPAIRLGFVVVPSALAETLSRTVALGMPAPSPFIQHAMMLFMQNGHYLRHLRRMKLLYRRGAEALRACIQADVAETMSGLALLVRLPPGADDRAICSAARQAGYGPSALSGWYADRTAAPPGLLLGVTNVDATNAKEVWRNLERLMGGLP
ncbi:MAG: PLP-dependent aminotransferase family protein [Deltaproteobacteria bacterium]